MQPQARAQGLQASPPDSHPAPVSSPPAIQLASATDESSPPGYDQAIDQAIDEHERGNFEEAREHFRAAHEIFPNARTLRGLGKVEFELRNYGESVKFLSAALAAPVRPLPADLRDEVQHILERACAYVGEVHVDVQPGSASVSVDGVTVATGPEAQLALLVGDHLLEFRASGRLPERRRVTIRGRQQLNVQVVLQSPNVHPADRMAMERDSRVRPAYKSWWLWTAVGVVVAGAAVGVGVAATRGHSAERPNAGTSGVLLRNP